MLAEDQDVGADAQYLGRAVVVTLLSSVSIRVLKIAILEQRPSLMISWLSSSIKFSLRSLSLYMWLLAIERCATKTFIHAFA